MTKPAHNRVSVEEAISRCVAAHKGKYVYDKDDFGYTCRRGMVNVICPSHGKYSISFTHHSAGKGICPACKYFARIDHLRRNGLYTYSDNAILEDGKTVIATCEHHGEFTTTYRLQVSGTGYCPKCANILCSRDNKEFIRRVSAIFGEALSFDKTVFNTTRKKVIVTCSKHGDYEVRPVDLLRGNKCCVRCKRESHAEKIKLPLQEYKARLLASMPDCEVLEYSYLTHVAKFLHKPCGEEYYAMPASVLLSSNCPNCTVGGFDKGKNGLLYYIMFMLDNAAVFKVGITNFTVSKRFSGHDIIVDPEILASYSCCGEKVHEAEQRILKTFKQYKYSGEERFDGYTECFTVDISQFEEFQNIVKDLQSGE